MPDVSARKRGICRARRTEHTSLIVELGQRARASWSAARGERHGCEHVAVRERHETVRRDEPGQLVDLANEARVRMCLRVEQKKLSAVKAAREEVPSLHEVLLGMMRH